MRHVHVSPDSRWVVTVSHLESDSGARTKLWDADTGRLAADIAPGDNFAGFSPDGRWLYLGGRGGERRVEIASLASGSGDDKGKCESFRFQGVVSPDGRLRACEASDGGLRLVAAETDEEVARLPSPEGSQFRPHTFSPDGSLLLAHEPEAGALYVFDLALLRAQLAGLGLDWGDEPPRPRDVDPARAEPLRVELIEAESAGNEANLAGAECRRAAARLVFNPFDAEAHFRLGKFLSEAGRLEEAYARLTAALAFGPELEEALAARVQVAMLLGRWDAAAADADRYLEKYPFVHRVRRFRARVNLARRRFEDAAADWTALLVEMPEDREALLGRAEGYEALGKTDLAGADRERARRIGERGAPGSK